MLKPQKKNFNISSSVYDFQLNLDLIVQLVSNSTQFNLVQFNLLALLLIETLSIQINVTCFGPENKASASVKATTNGQHSNRYNSAAWTQFGQV